MKIIKKINILILLSLILAQSCKEDDDFGQAETAPLNIAEIINERTDLNTLAGALVQADLDATLRSTTTYTVFAPNDEAFSTVNISELSEFQLQNTLLNHVKATVTADFASTLQTGYFNTLATGPDGNNLSFYTNSLESTTFNGIATLVNNASDIGATNGVVHVVNQVLTPPTVLDHIQANPNYSLLAEAIETADLGDALSLMNEEDDNFPYTVFAPNNMAFEALMSQLNGAFGWQTIDEIPLDILQQVLLYHVVPSTNLVSAEANDASLSSLQGESFSIDANTNIDDASYDTTSITLTDIQSINGIVHGIDKVLLPDTVFQSVLDQILNIVERCNDKEFTMFTTAVEMVGLTTQVSTDELTAFAPNNSAFTSFFLTIENFDSLEDFDTPEELALLKNVVEYHLYAGNLMASQLTPDMVIETLQGDSFTFNQESLSFVPTFENASSASIVTSNIGASNGIIHEIDNVLVSEVDAPGLGYPMPASGAAVYGHEIYDDALNAAYWIGGWTTPDFTSTDEVKSGVYSIRVDYAGDDGFQIGGSNVDLTQFSTVNAALYSENGTSVTFILNEQWGSGQTVNIPAGEWTNVSVPIVNIANGTTELTQLVIRDASLTANTLYMDEVGLDVTYENPIPTFTYEVYTENNLNADWVGGWTAPVFDDTTNPKTGVYSIKNVMPADQGFQLGGTNIDLSAYSVVKFSIYCEDTTTFRLVLNEQWGSGFVINPIAGQWNDYTVSLNDVLNGTTAYTQFVIQEIGLNDVEVFIDDIGFD